MGGQRFTQNKPRLRQWTLGGVDQQQHPVHHGQPALHLATEVRVPRGVYDIDYGDGSIRVMAVHGGVLGQDGDALLPLQIARVHHPFLQLTAFTQRPGLPQHGVNQGGLAVVDVRDDGTLRNGTTVIVAENYHPRRRGAEPINSCLAATSRLRYTM